MEYGKFNCECTEYGRNKLGVTVLYGEIVCRLGIAKFLLGTFYPDWTEFWVKKFEVTELYGRLMPQVKFVGHLRIHIENI